MPHGSAKTKKKGNILGTMAKIAWGIPHNSLCHLVTIIFLSFFFFFSHAPEFTVVYAIRYRVQLKYLAVDQNPGLPLPGCRLVSGPQLCSRAASSHPWNERRSVICRFLFEAFKRQDSLLFFLSAVCRGLQGPIFHIYGLVLFFWAAPRGLQDLCSPTRDQTWALGSDSTES